MGRKPGDGSDGGSEPPSFADAMEREGEVTPLDRTRARRAAADDASPLPPEPTRPVRFVLPDPAEPLLGHAPGVQRRELRRLRSGTPAAECEIDLHGLDRSRARRALREGLEQALREGRVLVRVVHGKGHHSADGPVLRAALPAWLAEHPHGPFVRAFAPAPGAEGGTGATNVWLRERA